MQRSTLKRIVDWVMPRIARVEMEGLEHIPSEGPAILVFNHLGLLDIALAFYAVERQDVTGWVADKHLKNPVYRPLINAMDGVWLNRENPDMSSFKIALAWLREGHIFGVAPEGTRSLTHSLQEGKEGVAYLAALSGATIVPGGQTGTEKMGRQWLRLRRPRLTLRMGEPFTLPPLERKHRDAQLKEGIDEIMCRIAALLPESYRGMYADHPRLKELLSGHLEPVAEAVRA